MSKFKDLFFSLSSPFMPLASLPLMQKLSGTLITIPVYHAVADFIAPHLKYLNITRTPLQFSNDLDTLLKYFTPVSLHDLLELTLGNEKPKKPVFHITFDDGLHEFYDIASPILLKKGIPATCFLNNGFIDNKDMLYRFKASLLIDHLHNQPVKSGAWKIFYDWLDENEAKENYYQKTLLNIRHSQEYRLEQLARALGVDFMGYINEKQPYMSTKQIKELINKGFTFGAHTYTHADLWLLGKERQVKEIKDSMENITSTFNLDYSIFSFPFTDFGIQKGVFEKIRQENICGLTFGCAGIKNDIAYNHLQRIPVETNKSSMTTILKKEFLYYNMLKISGKGTLKRP